MEQTIESRADKVERLTAKVLGEISAELETAKKRIHSADIDFTDNLHELRQQEDMPGMQKFMTFNYHLNRYYQFMRLLEYFQCDNPFMAKTLLSHEDVVPDDVIDYYLKDEVNFIHVFMGAVREWAWNAAGIVDFVDDSDKSPFATEKTSLVETDILNMDDYMSASLVAKAGRQDMIWNDLEHEYRNKLKKGGAVETCG